MSGDERPQLTRRFAKGKGGQALIRRAKELARLEDEAGFREMLHQLDLWEGMPAFEKGLAIFRDLCRELPRSEHL